MKLDTHGATMPSITTMLSAIAQRRSDPAAARQMIDSIFRGASESAKRSYCQFLFASIAHLSRDNPDRWGVTLREYGVRLNAGWVESLVLWKGEPLRVLIEQKSAPAAATFCDCSYRYARGCKMVALSLSELPRSLPKFALSHQRALGIAASSMPPPPSIRNAHSPGVTEWLSQVLHRPVPAPAYFSDKPDFPGLRAVE